MSVDCTTESYHLFLRSSSEVKAFSRSYSRCKAYGQDGKGKTLLQCRRRLRWETYRQDEEKHKKMPYNPRSSITSNRKLKSNSNSKQQAATATTTARATAIATAIAVTATRARMTTKQATINNKKKATKMAVKMAVVTATPKQRHCRR